MVTPITGSLSSSPASLAGTNSGFFIAGIASGGNAYIISSFSSVSAKHIKSELITEITEQAIKQNSGKYFTRNIGLTTENVVIVEILETSMG
jgi:hypothetical protein